MQNSCVHSEVYNSEMGLFGTRSTALLNYMNYLVFALIKSEASLQHGRGKGMKGYG